MASSSDSWMKEFNEASKLADDIHSMIQERGSLPTSGPEARHVSTIRRKITILGTRLDSLESFFPKLPKQPRSDKEYHKRQDMLASLRSKANQMASTLNMSNFGNREDLLGPGRKTTDEITRTEGLDNHGIVGLQRQIMKEQDEGLEQLEDTVQSTKHIALAVNEELTLHTRLIVCRLSKILLRFLRCFIFPQCISCICFLTRGPSTGSFGSTCGCHRFSSSESAKEIGDPQQAHKGRVHLHEFNPINDWHCHACGCRLAPD